LVDQQRRSFVERRGEGDRVRAVDGRLGAGDRHQRRSARRGEGDQARLSQATRVVAEFARGVASVLGEEREPKGFGAAAKVSKGSVEAKLGDPAFGVAMNCGRGWRSHNWLSVADDPSRSQSGQIVHEMGKPARAFAVRVSRDCRSRQRERRIVAGAGAANRASGEVSRFLETEAPHHANAGSVRFRA
jgi:hypothetical protein